jgi:hypothetical protein
MSRTLKRPMFRMGGSTGTGITSGLDQPRKQYREGPPNPYDMGAFSPGSLPGFLTSFGLDMLSRPPQGNIFQTAAASAKGPFERYQGAQMQRGQQMGERDFLRSERLEGQEFDESQLKAKLESDEKIAGMRTNKDDVLYNVSLESFLETLPPMVAERAATFNTEIADVLRNSVGGQKYGGVLEFDIRDPEQSKIMKKQNKRFDNKVFYDPFEDNYKYVVIKNGVISFDEFTTIPEIKFPDFTASQPEKIDRSVPEFGLTPDQP